VKIAKRTQIGPSGKITQCAKMFRGVPGYSKSAKNAKRSQRSSKSHGIQGGKGCGKWESGYFAGRSMPGGGIAGTFVGSNRLGTV